MNEDYKLLIIAFFLIISASFSSFIAGYVISAYQDSHFPDTYFDHIRKGANTVLLGVIFTSPALLFAALPTSFHLYGKHNNPLIWFLALTFIAFLYSLLWILPSDPLENKDEVIRFVILVTGTGFLTSIFTWLFIYKIRMSWHVWLIITLLFISIIGLINSYEKLLTEEQKRNIERLKSEGRL